MMDWAEHLRVTARLTGQGFFHFTRGAERDIFVALAPDGTFSFTYADQGWRCVKDQVLNDLLHAEPDLVFLGVLTS